MKTTKLILTAVILTLNLNSALASGNTNQTAEVVLPPAGSELTVKLTGQEADPAEVAKAQACQYAYQWICTPMGGCSYQYFWMCF